MRTFSSFILLLLTLLSASWLAPDAEARSRNAKILVDGADIAGTNGIAVGPDGQLYVTSVSGREIVVMDRRSGRILDRLGMDLGVETPDDVAFGPDGSLYWTALFAGQVGRLQPDGTASIVATLPPGPNPIAFNAEGRLFVGLAAFGDGLYEIDPEGVQPPRLILAATDGLNGFAFGPDGSLYSPQTRTGSIVKIDVDAPSVTVVATGFTLPVALDFDSQGRLYVNDTAVDQIVRLDLATGQREVFAELSDGVDNLAFDADDNLYVTSLLQGSVRRVSQPVGAAEAHVRTLRPGGMTTPGGVAVLPSVVPGGEREEVWIADFFSLRAFDDASGQERVFEPSIPGISAITAPFTAAPAPGTNGEPRLLLTSWLLNAVQLYAAESGQIVLNLNDFAVPLNAIQFQGDLVVAELGTGSVVRADGADPSQRTTIGAGLFVPTGLAASDDDLWAADWATGSVFQLIQAGQVLAAPVLVASGLAGPEGLALLPDGNLVVVEALAGRVSRVDVATGAVTPVAIDLGLGAPPPPLAPPTWIFNGVAVGARGRLYVSGDVENVVYELR